MHGQAVSWGNTVYYVVLASFSMKEKPCDNLEIADYKDINVNKIFWSTEFNLEINKQEVYFQSPFVQVFKPIWLVGGDYGM